MSSNVRVFYEFEVKNNNKSDLKLSSPSFGSIRSEIPDLVRIRTKMVWNRSGIGYRGPDFFEMLLLRL